MVFSMWESRAENSGLKLQGYMLWIFAALNCRHVTWDKVYFGWGCGFWSDQLENRSLPYDYKGVGRWGLLGIFCPQNWVVYIFLWLFSLLFSVWSWKFINSSFFSFFHTTIKIVWYFRGEGALSERVQHLQQQNCMLSWGILSILKADWSSITGVKAFLGKQFKSKVMEWNRFCSHYNFCLKNSRLSWFEEFLCAREL